MSNKTVFLIRPDHAEEDANLADFHMKNLQKNHPKKNFVKQNGRDILRGVDTVEILEQ